MAHKRINKILENRNKIIEFAKSNGGHVGFKEIQVGGYSTFTNVSVFSDGVMEYTNNDGFFRDRKFCYTIHMRGHKALDSMLQLIQENKFL